MRLLKSHFSRLFLGADQCLIYLWKVIVARDKADRGVFGTHLVKHFTVKAVVQNPIHFPKLSLELLLCQLCLGRKFDEFSALQTL